MAYSTLKITFNAVPYEGEVLNLFESKNGLNLNTIFKESRAVAGEVRIPAYQEYDGMHAARYIGYVSSFYKSAFNLDYNVGDFFTVTATAGELNDGLGEVTITANFSDAVFDVVTNTAEISVVINNETYVAPPMDDIEFSPTALSFKHEQNAAFENKSILISGDLWKVEGKPNFLLRSKSLGVTVATVTDGIGTYQTVSGSGSAIIGVSPTSFYDGPSLLGAADLSGAFTIYKNNIFYGTVAFSIIVTSLSDFVTIPYAAEGKAFTLDPKFFEFKSSNLDSYFQFDSTIKTYDFFTNAVNEYFIPLKIVLFNGKAKENLGQVIHRLMRRFTDVNETLLQYKEATLKLNCSEIDIASGLTIRSGTSFDIPFVAGLSRGITTLGFLDFNQSPNRVTKKGFAYLNILIPAGNYELRTFKNGTLLSAVALPGSTGKILCKKVLFSGFEKGDVIEFVLDTVGGTDLQAPKKTYILYPDNNFSNMIVWENEFLLQSALECTGTASLVGEGQFQSQTVRVDLVDNLEHLSSSKESKLYINTGWLLYSDIDTVESLMRSKKAWLLQGSTSISLRPISKKLPPKDLLEELIQFSLEFQINAKYNEETYSL